MTIEKESNDESYVMMINVNVTVDSSYFITSIEN